MLIKSAMTYCLDPEAPLLTVRQLAMLGHMAKGPVPLHALAGRVRVAKPVVTRAMRVLEDYGLAKREKVEADARQRNCVLTTAGKAFVARANAWRAQ